MYLQVCLLAALCSAVPAVQTCRDPGQCFAHVKQTLLLLLHLTRRPGFENVHPKHYLKQLRNAFPQPFIYITLHTAQCV